MKINFVILATGINGLENGSFSKLYLNGEHSVFINGDFMGNFDTCPNGYILDDVTLRAFSWKQAKKHLPKVCGGTQ